MIEKTLVLLKPDAVTRGLIGEIIARFENVGLKLSGMKMVWIDKDFAKKHYEPHVQKAFYKSLEEFVIDGPIVAMAWEGISAVQVVRKLVGATEPLTAAPGTIRGDFAHHSYSYTDKKGIAIKNLIHASSDPKEAERELGLWFKKDELHTYQTTHEKHTL